MSTSSPLSQNKIKTCSSLELLVAFGQSHNISDRFVRRIIIVFIFLIYLSDLYVCNVQKIIYLTKTVIIQFKIIWKTPELYALLQIIICMHAVNMIIQFKI